MLSSPSSSTLDWVWTASNPVSWNEYESSSPTGPWSLSASFAGSVRTDTGADSEQWFYVQGVDGSGNPVTQPSNIVQSM